MLVTNSTSFNRTLYYKVNGKLKRVLIPRNSSLNITDFDNVVNVSIFTQKLISKGFIVTAPSKKIKKVKNGESLVIPDNQVFSGFNGIELGEDSCLEIGENSVIELL